MLSPRHPPAVFSEPLRACIGHWNMTLNKTAKPLFYPVSFLHGGTGDEVHHFPNYSDTGSDETTTPGADFMGLPR